MEPVDQGHQRIGLGAIVGFASLPAMVHQFGPLEHGEVLGDSGLRYACVAGQCVNGLFAVAGQLLKNGATGGISEGAKDRIGLGWLHTENITIRLCFVKSREWVPMFPISLWKVPWEVTVLRL